MIPGFDEQSICFDSAGSFWSNGKASHGGKALQSDTVASVLLNLDEKSPNFNTVSLFRDGHRVTQPHALPDALKGKALFPTVAFKNLTVHVNFGAHALEPLPFKCHMIQEASTKDAVVVAPPVPKDGKFDVVLPVGMPDEGTFAWLDMFHKQNPGYTELSNRALLAWAQKSGLHRQNGWNAFSCNDKPETHLNCGPLDDGTVIRYIKDFAVMQGRNYVVMEVRGNLIAEEREKLLKKFSASCFRKMALVQIGDPDAAFKKKTREVMLQKKQEKSDKDFRTGIENEKRKREAARKKRQTEILRKRSEKEAKKKLKEARKKAEATKREAAKKKAEAEGKEPPAEEPAEISEEEPEEVEEPEVEEPEVKDETPPTVELDEDEKKLCTLSLRHQIYLRTS